jgi:hypothetical protein
MLKSFFVAFNRPPRALAALTLGRLHHLGHVTEILHAPIIIVWADEIDIAPEALYSLDTQTPLTEWMRSDKPMRETA